MKKRTHLGIIIGVGVVFAVALTFIAFAFWKYLQQRKKKEENTRNDAVVLQNFAPDVLVLPNELPVDCCAVLAQEPLLFNDHRSTWIDPSKTIAKKRESGNISVEWINEGSNKLEFEHGGSLNSVKSGCCEPKSTELNREYLLLKECFGIAAHNEAKIDIESFRKTPTQQGINARGVSLNKYMFIEPENTGSYADTSHESVSLTTPLIKMFQPKDKYKRDDDTQLEGFYKRAGKLILRMSYSGKQKELEIHILKAFDLAQNRDKDEIFPFVRVYLIPGKREKQDTKYKKPATKEPFFNEKIVFEGVKKDELLLKKLKIKVCNHSIVKKIEILGETELALSEIDFDREKTFCAPLFQPPNEVAFASISLSICHEAMLSKLIVIVHDAYLPKAGKTILNSNPYVTLQLHKDELMVSCQHTSSKRTKTNPCYEERFEFPMHATKVDDLGKYSLYVSLRLNNYLGKRSIIGQIMLGLNSSQRSGYLQWKSVLDLPHTYSKSIHALIDPNKL